MFLLLLLFIFSLFIVADPRLLLVFLGLVQFYFFYYSAAAAAAAFQHLYAVDTDSFLNSCLHLKHFLSSTSFSFFFCRVLVFILHFQHLQKYNIFPSKLHIRIIIIRFFLCFRKKKSVSTTSFFAFQFHLKACALWGIKTNYINLH